MTADHTPERLSAEERAALLGLLPADPDAPFLFLDEAERILAAHLADVEARLAAVEALADEWERRGDEDPFDPSDPLGYASDLRAALHPAPSGQPAQGGVDT